MKKLLWYSKLAISEILSFPSLMICLIASLFSFFTYCVTGEDDERENVVASVESLIDCYESCHYVRVTHVIGFDDGKDVT